MPPSNQSAIAIVREHLQDCCGASVTATPTKEDPWAIQFLVEDPSRSASITIDREECWCLANRTEPWGAFIRKWYDQCSHRQKRKTPPG